MSSSIKNIVLILTFAVLVPIAAFTISEVSTLNENEEALEEAYREQLNSIIFSINQYSADLFTFYFNQIDFQWKQSEHEKLFDSLFLQQNLAIEALVIYQNGSSVLYDLNSFSPSSTNSSNFEALFDQNKETTERLIRYKQADYIKPEALGTTIYEEDTLNVNLIIVGKETPCLFLINPVNYIEDLLGPKIKEIASKELAITIRHKPTDSFIYLEGEQAQGIVQLGQLWLLEDYEIGVSLKDQSIEELISYRTRKSIISMILLVALVAIGIILVIRNLRREIQLSKAKADFVANVSHEIRTPLSLISMFNETLLLNRVPNEKKQEYYEIIAKETSRLKNIVNKILSFSQIDANKKSYHAQTICPNEEIKEVIDSYSYHLEEKGFEYALDLEPTNQKIKADREAFVEAIINLVDNAIKYSPTNKYVRISTTSTEDKFIVSVTDTGIGIHKKNRDQIFEKFYRVTEGDKYTVKGTGLGLSLVAGIMKAHNGKVELDSQLDKGSTFRLIFPIK